MTVLFNFGKEEGKGREEGRGKDRLRHCRGKAGKGERCRVEVG